MLKKTKEEKEMQGTYEPSKEVLEPVKFDSLDKIPNAPDRWTPGAQKMWRTLCGELQKNGYLSAAFLPAFKKYVFAVYLSDLAERKIIENGEEMVMSEAGTYWMKVLNEQNKTIIQLGSKFGFTPYDAAKIPKIIQEPGQTMSLLK